MQTISGAYGKKLSIRRFLSCGPAWFYPSSSIIIDIYSLIYYSALFLAWTSHFWEKARYPHLSTSLEALLWLDLEKRHFQNPASLFQSRIYSILSLHGCVNSSLPSLSLRRCRLYLVRSYRSNPKKAIPIFSLLRQRSS